MGNSEQEQIERYLPILKRNINADFLMRAPSSGHWYELLSNPFDAYEEEFNRLLFIVVAKQLIEGASKNANMRNQLINEAIEVYAYIFVALEELDEELANFINEQSSLIHDLIVNIPVLIREYFNLYPIEPSSEQLQTCLDELNKQIQPSFIENLPRTRLWSNLLLSIPDKVDEINRLCLLNLLQGLITESIHNVSLRNQLIYHDDQVTIVLINAYEDYLPEFITLLLGNRDALISELIPKIAELVQTYFDNNPVNLSITEVEGITKQLTQHIDRRFLKSTPQTGIWLELTKPLNDELEEIERLARLNIIQNIIKQSIDDRQLRMQCLDGDEVIYVEVSFAYEQLNQILNEVVPNLDQFIFDTFKQLIEASNAYFADFEDVFNPDEVSQLMINLNRKLNHDFIARVDNIEEWTKMVTSVRDPYDEINRLCCLIIIQSLLLQAIKNVNLKLECQKPKNGLDERLLVAYDELVGNDVAKLIGNKNIVINRIKEALPELCESFFMKL